MSTSLVKLSAAESNRKKEIEAEVRACCAEGRRHQFTIGRLLDEVLRTRLYRDTHDSFERYCEDEFGLSGSVARKAANTYRVVRNLSGAQEATPDAFWELLTGLKPSHAQVLSSLPDEAQPLAWSEARTETVTPTVKALEEVAAKYKSEAGAAKTAEEERDFHARSSEESLAAYRRERVRSLAGETAKRLCGLIRKLETPAVVADAFASHRKLLAEIAEELDAMAELEPEEEKASF